MVTALLGKKNGARAAAKHLSTCIERHSANAGPNGGVRENGFQLKETREGVARKMVRMGVFLLLLLLFCTNMKSQ